MKKSDIDMLKSCYAYGYLGWSSYYLDIEAKYGKEVTEAEVKKLKSKYEVKHSVFTDGEDCSYNELVEKY